MRAFAFLLLLPLAALANDVYRWVDERGTVNYSNGKPPAGVRASRVDAEADPRNPVAESSECYTQLCQGERLEQRLVRREQIEARRSAERGAIAPRPVKGLEFRRYAAIERGMSEDEFVGVAGEPDLLLWDSRAVKSYTYYPTASDPFTTTVILTNGLVSDIERSR